MKTLEKTIEEINKLKTIITSLKEDSDKRNTSYQSRSSTMGLNNIMLIISDINISLNKTFNQQAETIQKLVKKRPYRFLLNNIPHTELYDRLTRVLNLVTSLTLSIQIYYTCLDPDLNGDSKEVTDFYNNLFSLTSWMEHYIETYKINIDILTELDKD